MHKIQIIALSGKVIFRILKLNVLQSVMHGGIIQR